MGARDGDGRVSGELVGFEEEYEFFLFGLLFGAGVGCSGHGGGAIRG
jgi:hypothetical protein